MEGIRVIILNQWWQDPLLIAILSSMLTGLFFALVLHYHNRWMEKRDLIVSVETELSNNYNFLKNIQSTNKVQNIEGFKDMIDLLRKEMPNKNDLSDKDIFLNFFKNMPLDEQVSVSFWKDSGAKLAKFKKEYSKVNPLYVTLARLIQFSRIKKGEIKPENQATFHAVHQFDAIRINSEEFIKLYEEAFSKKKIKQRLAGCVKTLIGLRRRPRTA